MLQLDVTLAAELPAQGAFICLFFRHRMQASPLQPEDQLAVIAGDEAEAGMYTLPSVIAATAQAQYEKDVARVHGGSVQSSEAEYRDFLSSLGGGPPGQDGLPPPPGGASGRGAPRQVHIAGLACPEFCSQQCMSHATVDPALRVNWSELAIVHVLVA